MPSAAPRPAARLFAHPGTARRASRCSHGAFPRSQTRGLSARRVLDARGSPAEVKLRSVASPAVLVAQARRSTIAVALASPSAPAVVHAAGATGDCTRPAPPLRPGVVGTAPEWRRDPVRHTFPQGLHATSAARLSEWPAFGWRSARDGLPGRMVLTSLGGQSRRAPGAENRAQQPKTGGRPLPEPRETAPGRRRCRTPDGERLAAAGRWARARGAPRRFHSLAYGRPPACWRRTASDARSLRSMRAGDVMKRARREGA